MNIRSITFKDYRCFEGETKIELSPTINIFVGTNDSGKSSILSALAIFVKDSQGSIKTGELARDFRHKSDSFQVSLECNCVENVAFDTKIQGNTRGIVSATKDGLLEVSLNYSRNAQALTVALANSNSNKSSFHTSQILSNRRPDSPLIVVDSPRMLRGSSGVGASEVSFLPSQGNNCAALIDEIVSMPGSLRNEFESLIRKVLPIEIGVIPWQNNQKKIGRYTHQEQILDAHRMGAGISEVAFLIAVCVKEKNKVIAIDEIEQSMHPSILKKLLEVLSQKAVENSLQFILTTHSNIVLSRLGAVPGARSYELTHDYQSEQTSVQLLGKEEERLDALSRLGYELSDIGLYDYFIITEESSLQAFLEKIILPKFFPAIHAKIKIIASSGVSDVEPRLKILERLYLFQYLNGNYVNRTWVICDGDRAGRDTIEKLKDKFPSVSDRLLTLEEEKVLEDYFPDSVRSRVLSMHSLRSLEELADCEKSQKREIKKELLLAVLDKAEESPDFFEDAASGLIELINLNVNLPIVGEEAP